jgi:hypothetical protein
MLSKPILIGTRVDEPFFEKIENWRRAQPDLPGRSQALRELLEVALARTEAAKPAAA